MFQNRAYWAESVAIPLLTALFASGCGGKQDLPQVTGLVTLDGAPVAAARVSFYPSSGRAAVGTTDKKGRYRLRTANESSGVEIGEYLVTISTWTPGRPGQGPDAVSLPGTSELIPRALTAKETSKLRKQVSPGANVIDFPLNSTPTTEPAK